MAKLIAIQPGVLYPQPDYTLSVDREGKWTSTVTFLCHRSSIVQLMPRPGTPHPDASFIAVDNATAKVTEGDLAEITCNYAGAEAKTPERERSEMSYSMGLSLSEEPLLSNYRYKDLEDAEVEALKAIIAGKDDANAPSKDKITSELGKEALKKIMRGETSYYSPKVAWRASITRDRGVAGGDLNDIGKVSTPYGPAPTLATNRNWLLNGVSQSQEGRSFRIEWEWLASDRGGWDPDIYSNET